MGKDRNTKRVIVRKTKRQRRCDFQSSRHTQYHHPHHQSQPHGSCWTRPASLSFWGDITLGIKRSACTILKVLSIQTIFPHTSDTNNIFRVCIEWLFESTGIWSIAPNKPLSSQSVAMTTAVHVQSPQSTINKPWIHII